MMLNPEGIPLGFNGATEAVPDPNAALRFEDLTIDDELSLLDRVVRYVRSGIALQRLVHVKMIAETATTVGTLSTLQRLVPLLPPLVVDSESIIRQHLASQLLPLCLTCMFGDITDDDFDIHDHKSKQFQTRSFNDEGYRIVTSTILNHLNTLITDPDVDVRKAASDALATLALYIKPDDIGAMILPIPLRLAHSANNNDNQNSAGPGSKQNEKESGNNSTFNDDFHITATNLLGDIASLDSNQIPPSLVSQFISPAILSLCKHSSFRVRRAAVQALPRVVHGSSIDDIEKNLLPCFQRLSNDEMYRVRKSVGECLVDMSRSLMLLPSSPNSAKPTVGGEDKYSKMNENEVMEVMMSMRRTKLVPICTKLLADSNKFVRNGMMQFLGPFIASFYPLAGGNSNVNQYNKTNYYDSGIINMLSDERKENRIGGMGVQFFPHANGMVSRLNPTSISAPAVAKKESSTNSVDYPLDSKEHLESLLPPFLEKCHNDAKSLVMILHHRERFPISKADAKIVFDTLLPPYVELSTITTGDENIDAEMRVYCAYSLPAVILLLGKNGWDNSLKKCFLALITGQTGVEDPSTVPLPVKRCLASSFHTICHVLGQQALKGSSEEKSSKTDLLSIFETHFLRDTDDTVRLNVIRNLPSFLSLLSFSKRSKYLPILYEIITGDAMLASKRKNALNPMILNWRQRDMIAQIIPNLIILFKPSQVRQYIWPLVKILMSDPVNLVKENVEWSIPIIIRCYETKKCKYDNDDIDVASKFSSEACNEVFVFLKATLLDNKPPSASSSSTSVSYAKIKTSGSFSKRQSYCRVLTAVSLILRLNDKEKRRLRKKEIKDETLDFPPHSFYNLSSDEYRHVYNVLQGLLLPSAIVMKDDRVTNVRLALAKCLRVMPPNIRDNGEVSVILSTLEEEIHTWQGGGGQYIDGNGPANSSPSKASTSTKTGGSATKKKPSPIPTSAGDDATQRAIERGIQQAEEDEQRLKQKKVIEGDDSTSMASI